ncbi:MAG: DinB family protein [Candidatus Hydrogenedentota bacterium]
MTPEVLVNQLKASKVYLDRATSALTEDDSTYAPDENSFTAAQQLAHIALTVDWFIEGGFEKGFDMNFEEHPLQARDVTSIEKARALCTENYDKAISLIGSKTLEQILEPMPEGPIMGGDPKLVVVAGIVEHTAHHRGSLSVYTRLCGKVPPMPYMDADAMAGS